MLKITRAGIALIVWLVVTFYFLDFAELLPEYTSGLAKVQLVPAILAGSVVTVGVLVLLTLLLGRVYCSVVCPLGIFQDIVARFRRGKRGKYKYYRPRPLLRYTALGVFVLALVLGVAVIPALIEPYSAYGRIVTNVWRPLYMLGNNLLAGALTSLGSHVFYRVDVFMQSGLAFIIGFITFVVISYLAWRHGRLWCNTICPVGSALGFASKYSLFRVTIDKSRCNSCGACASRCKSSCIDSRARAVDNSRCVVCFNCLEHCHKKALHYVPRTRKSEYVASEKAVAIKVSETVPDTVDASRRRFLAAATVSTLAIPAVVAQDRAGVLATLSGQKAFRRQHPITPPGSKGAEQLHARCTSCHLCVSRCPSRVIKPAFMEYGLTGVMQPRVDFEHGFCNFDCTICGEVCPNGAIQPLSKEQKHLTQMGHVVFIRENCIVYTDETSCGACSEHCPTQALSMVPYKEGLTIPQVNVEICVGCGGCEYICPARPFRAVYIEGNPVHLEAKPIVKSDQKEILIDDFGF